MNPWVKGLLAGIISGTTQGVLTGFTANGIAPGSFSPTSHFTNFIVLAVEAAVVGGVVGAATYLSKSPLP